MAGTESGMPPTLADVATRAGVSSATASRVLSGSAHVRPQTRRKVTAAVASLGYVRNRAARSTEPRPAGSIALVVCEENVRAFGDPFFARLLWSVTRELDAEDLQLVLLTLHSPHDGQKVPRYLRSGHVDGAMFVGVHGKVTLDVAGLGIPVVLCGRPVNDGEGLSYVDADNVGGAEAAVQYLIGKGRTAIATVAGPPDRGPGIDRLVGYRKGMASAGMSDSGMVAYGDFSRSSGEHAMLRLIDHRPGLDAVFAASDLMAAGAIRALQRVGRRVPDDVAVIGFDDSPVAQQTSPPLSTVRQPIDAMAARMTRELINLIGTMGQEPFRMVFDTKLILRESA